VRAVAILVVMMSACAYDALDGDVGDTDVPAAAEGLADDGTAIITIDPSEPTLSLDAPREVLDIPETVVPRQWSFAVLSDLHLPNPRSANIDRTVAALIELGVRFVVVTGDHTNGSAIVDHRKARARAWWNSVSNALAPLREAGIAVLPIAGNHDTYLAWHRDGYEQAFGDLARWAAPLTIRPAAGHGFARAPYSYSVDVDGVHLSLANIVDQNVDRDVQAWLTEDLATPAAQAARVRMVFGHVPLFSVIRRPPRGFVEQLGGILARGNVDFYVAGHEHVTWDETFSVAATPGASRSLRQVTVGCSSGFYVFAPSKAARTRASCEPSRDAGARGGMRCTMPNGGRFELVRDRSQRLIEHDSATFTVFTVTGDDVQVTPMTVDDEGRPASFYLAD